MSLESESPNIATRDVLRWVRSLLANYPWQVIGAIGALLVAAGSWLVLGQGIKMAVDKGFINDNADMLNRAVIFVLVITAIASMATYFRFYLMTWLG
ncbi:ABC transporter permease, partial [Alteromonas sp. 14N.309.X.WAT.G.H12]